MKNGRIGISTSLDSLFLLVLWELHTIYLFYIYIIHPLFIFWIQLPKFVGFLYVCSFVFLALRPSFITQLLLISGFWLEHGWFPSDYIFRENCLYLSQKWRRRRRRRKGRRREDKGEVRKQKGFFLWKGALERMQVWLTRSGKNPSQACWCAPLMPVLGKPRQEAHRLKASLGATYWDTFSKELSRYKKTITSKFHLCEVHRKDTGC